MRRFFFRSTGEFWTEHPREGLAAWSRRQGGESREREAEGLLRQAALRARLERERLGAEEREGNGERLEARRRCETFALAVHRVAGELRGEGSSQVATCLLGVARLAHGSVVEGCGRRLRRDCLFFLRHAERSLEEAAYLLDTARRLGCLSRRAADELLALHLDAIRALDALVARLEGAGAPSPGSRALA